jgi:hypothetical protein
VISRPVIMMISRRVGVIGPWENRKAFMAVDQKWVRSLPCLLQSVLKLGICRFLSSDLICWLASSCTKQAR